jgi:hypothetical protein
MSSSSGYAGSASDGGGGNAVWSNPSNAEGAPDSNFATVTGSIFKHSGSDYLQCSDFALSIPGGATVTGLQVVVTAEASASGISGIQCNLTLGNSGFEFQGYAASPSGDVATSSTAYTFGSGTTDTWSLGAALTVSNLNLTTASNGSSGGPLVSVYSEGSSANPEVLSVDSVQLIAYYTGASPPGAPTGLSATADSDQSVTLSWTNPGGTLTDNEVQYSTDDATWTTIDIGSVATSYTVTGLSANTLYYFQVAAVNSGGTGSYCTAVTATTYPAPALPAPLGAPMGSGACPYGITHQMRRNRIEGVKFQHK